MAFLWCFWFCCVPIFKKIHHWRIRRKIDRHLTRLDNYDQMREERRKKPVIIYDGETGLAVGVDNGQTSSEDDSDEEAQRKSMELTDEALKSPSLSPGNKKKKKLNAKKQAKLEMMIKERKDFEAAMRAAVYVPKREERIAMAKKKFEKTIESGPMGFMVNRELREQVGHEYLQTLSLRRGNAAYFHKLAEEEANRGRSKRRYRPKPKVASPPGSPRQHRDRNVGFLSLGVIPPFGSEPNRGGGVGARASSPTDDKRRDANRPPSPGSPQRPGSPTSKLKGTVVATQNNLSLAVTSSRV